MDLKILFLNLISNFNIKKENLIHQATVEIMDAFAEPTRPLKDYKYAPLRDKVDRINDYKERKRLRQEARLAKQKEAARILKRK